ncbi:MAG: penicillin-binding protein 1A, partial [Polaribacter sp.]
KDMPYDLSLALGSGSFSPLEIVRGYAVFSNGGYLVDPHLISRIELGSGEIVFENTPKIACDDCVIETPMEDEVVVLESDPVAGLEVETFAIEDEAELIVKPAIQYAPRVITAQNAFIMRSIMREVVQRGTAVRAKALGRNDIGGKTGTTNDQVDAWFSGFNDQVATTAWVGFDDQQTLGARETGGRAALPIWIAYMRSALSGMPENLEQQPDDMVTVKIDSETGKRAGRDTGSSRFEIFRAANAPKELVISGAGGDSPSQSSVSVPENEDAIVDEIF